MLLIRTHTRAEFSYADLRGGDRIDIGECRGRDGNVKANANREDLKCLRIYQDVSISTM
jgi:hypothetical protein